MSELPDRPDLDQLRRQARELLRAAERGEPDAVARLGAVSDRVTLSAAQLAVAREYGYRSWPALKADVERRRLAQPAGHSPRPGGGEQGPGADLKEGWSFGGGTAIPTSAGVLVPEAVVADGSHATLYASVMPGNGHPPGGRAGLAASPRMPPWRRRLPWAGRARRRHVAAAMAALEVLADPGEMTVVDSGGARYALRPQGQWGQVGSSGKPARPSSVEFGLDPVPGREVSWLELRSQNGAATRLGRSPRAAVQIGRLTPLAVSPAERELIDRALSLIELQLISKGELPDDILSQSCSATLAEMEQIQRSGELGAASELPDQLRHLCAVLTRHRPADRLPASWSGMLSTAQHTDGPPHHLDIGTALPTIDGVAVQADSLISRPDHWQLYMRATPSWGSYSRDNLRPGTPILVHAQDDRGGMYVSRFGASMHRDLDQPGHDIVALRFVPRLDPHARALTLTFRGPDKEIAIDLRFEQP